MRLYAIKNQHRCLLTEVHLKDGFSPNVVGYDEEAKDLPAMEPAIWCTTMILDSITVDCDQRTLRWSTTQDTDCDAQDVHSLNECSDFDDEDELFHLARTLMEKPHNGNSRMSILRMLHCFVLPKVSFSTRDLYKIELARNQQMQYINTLNGKLDDKCFDTSDCQRKLDSMQEEFLPDIDKMINNGQCSKQFLEHLLCDLVEQERIVRQKIAIAEERYAQLVPTQVAELTLKRSSRELFEAREERDFLDKKLVLLLKVREEIIDQKEDLSDTMEIQPNIRVQEYIEKRYELQSLKEESIKLTEQQCCAISVKEMLEAILNDLQEHGHSQVANDADAQGARPTDVLQTNLQPEWQKLSERVATVTMNTKHPVGISFEKFCCEIHELCQEPLSKVRGCYPMTFRKSTFYVSLEPQEIMSNGDYECSYDSIAINSIVDPYQEKLFQIKEKISHHLEKATKLLSEHFEKKDLQFQNMLRLAYEICFYDKEHDSIHHLYECVYHKHVEDIERDIQRIKETFPVDLLALPVREWWSDVFKDCLSHTCSSTSLSHSESNGSFENSEDDSFAGDDSYSDRESAFISRRKARNLFINTVKDCARATTTKFKHIGSMSSLIDEWDSKAKPITESLERTLSIHSKSTDQDSNYLYSQDDRETFEDHFGPALQHMKAIFKTVTPLAKLKHMNSSLQYISSKVSELLHIQNYNRNNLFEEIAPLLVLIMFQLDTSEAASLWIQLVLVNDLMAPCLIDSCYSNTLEQYQRAHTILSNLWLELSDINMHCTVNGVTVSKTE